MELLLLDICKLNMVDKKIVWNIYFVFLTKLKENNIILNNYFNFLEILITKCNESV